MSRRRARPPVPRGVPLQLVWDATRDDSCLQQQQEQGAQQPASAVCPETVALLTELLQLARQGRVNGLAIAVLYSDNHYCPRVTGDARLSPTFARGMVRAIDDLLADHVRGL